MKINRLKLIALIDAEITRLNDRADERLQQDLREAERRRDAYFRRTCEAWGVFAQRINQALVAGNPVTTELIPTEIGNGHSNAFGGRSGFRYIEVWMPETVNRQTPNTTALEKLRAVLELSSDEEVSTYGLEKQGFPLGRTLGI